MDQENDRKSPKEELEDIQEKILMHEALAKDFEELLSSMPDTIDLPEALQFLSPKNMYAMLLLQIAGLKVEKATLLQSMGSKQRLAIQLAIAEEKEDYDLCIRLRNEINKLNDGNNNDNE